MIAISTTGDGEAAASVDVRVSAVVVNYGSHALLAANLPALGAGVDLVVVDNFSSAAERQAVGQLCDAHGWRLLAMAGNSGFGAAVNAGVSLAAEQGAEVVLIVNPDAVLGTEAVEQLTGECVRDPTVLVSPRIVREDGSTWFRGGRVLYHSGRTAMAGPDEAAGPDGWVSGACLAVPVAFWRTVGGFAPEYFMYWEDVELSHRWRLAGGRLLVRPDVLAVHAVGGTQTGSGSGRSALYYRYNCRNRLLFAASHVEDADLPAWVRSTGSYAKAVVLRGGRRQFLRHPLMPFLSAFRGSVEGLLVIRRRRRPGRHAAGTALLTAGGPAHPKAMS